MLPIRSFKLTFVVGFESPQLIRPFAPERAKVPKEKAVFRGEDTSPKESECFPRREEGPDDL